MSKRLLCFVWCVFLLSQCTSQHDGVEGSLESFEGTIIYEFDWINFDTTVPGIPAEAMSDSLVMYFGPNGERLWDFIGDKQYGATFFLYLPEGDTVFIGHADTDTLLYYDASVSMLDSMYMNDAANRSIMGVDCECFTTTINFEGLESGPFSEHYCYSDRICFDPKLYRNHRSEGQNHVYSRMQAPFLYAEFGPPYRRYSYTATKVTYQKLSASVFAVPNRPKKRMRIE